MKQECERTISPVGQVSHEAIDQGTPKEIQTDDSHRAAWPTLHAVVNARVRALCWWCIRASRIIITPIPNIRKITHQPIDS